MGLDPPLRAGESGSCDLAKALLCWPMIPEKPQRPAWLNWLFLLAFLWSSYQLAGLWAQRLHG